MRRLPIAVAFASLVVVSGSAAQVLPPPLPKLARFQTPSGNVACLYASEAARRPAYIRCDILTGLKPKPKRRCELDWTGFAMAGGGRASPVCAGDTVYDANARVLRYGKRWRRGPFRCVSRRAGLRCTNAGRRGFVLSRAGSFAF